MRGGPDELSCALLRPSIWCSIVARCVDLWTGLWPALGAVTWLPCWLVVVRPESLFSIYASAKCLCDCAQSLLLSSPWSLILDDGGADVTAVQGSPVPLNTSRTEGAAVTQQDAQLASATSTISVEEDPLDPGSTQPMHRVQLAIGWEPSEFWRMGEAKIQPVTSASEFVSGQTIPAC